MIGDKAKTSAVVSKVEKKIRDAFRQYVSPKEADYLVRLALFKARDDNKMLMFCIEHIFGRPTESLSIGNGGGAPLMIHISEAVAARYKLRDVEATEVKPKQLA